LRATNFYINYISLPTFVLLIEHKLISSSGSNLGQPMLQYKISFVAGEKPANTIDENPPARA
jgi:hypothetical protein